VQAILNSRGDLALYCNGREYSRLEYGDGLYSRVAAEILSVRAGGGRYPCYITDLDMPDEHGGASLQTVHLLRKKAELENSLNQALQELE
jgi:adenylate cyclase class 1